MKHPQRKKPFPKPFSTRQTNPSEKPVNADPHMKSVDEVLKKSPNVPGYGGGKWAMYSISCCWWTSFPEDLGENVVGFPCCPHCGSLLFQAPLDKFLESAKADPAHYGKFGLDAFLEAHSRNTDRCHAGWDKYNDDIWRRFHPRAPFTYG